SHAKDQLVALLQSFDGQVQPAKLVFPIWVGAGDVADQLRGELPQAGAEGVIQPVQVIVVPDAVGQVHVNRRRRLDRRIIILLMQRDSENVSAGVRLRLDAAGLQRLRAATGSKKCRGQAS